MAERKEIGFLKTTTNLKEQLARTALKNFRSQGHTYVELREDGKRFVFFCTLCLAPCYSDSILLEHLKGNLHRKRLSCAKITLLGSNPWPFSDGVLFFDTSTGDEGDPVSVSEGAPGSLLHDSDNNRLAIVKYDENNTSKSHGGNQPAADAIGEPTHCADHLLISGLLIKERTIDREARFIGFGRIAARLFETKGRSTWIDKIWCEWLGEEGPSDEEKATLPDHDFAIVTFSYFYNLGRLGLLNDPSRLLASSQSPESGKGGDSGRKRKKSFSDPEDTSESLCNQQDDSFEEVSSARSSNSSRALVADYDDNLVTKRIIKNRTVRRELRKQQMEFSERICEVCKHKLLPGKDTAAILNLKTGNLACNSRNPHGAFHLFHVSCVVHWFLFCETEILGSKMVSGKGRKRCKKQSGGKLNDLGNDGTTWEIYSVFCPECQGTGINNEGGVTERDTFPLSQTWRFQVKVGEGRKAWVKNPEKLKNCSTGFHFPQQSEDLGQVQNQEQRVQSLKSVRFYRVEL